MARHKLLGRSPWSRLTAAAPAVRREAARATDANDTGLVLLHRAGATPLLTAIRPTLPATPRPATPRPATPRPATPLPATPRPSTPQPATPLSAAEIDRLGSGGPFARRLLACRPEAEALAPLLARDPDRGTRLLLAQRDDLDEQVILDLIAGDDHQVLLALRGHPRHSSTTSARLWQRLLARLGPDSPSLLAGPAPTAALCLSWLADAAPESRAAIARIAPAELHPALASDPDERVRIGLLAHAGPGGQALWQLARDPSAAVRAAAARHPLLPVDLLFALAGDDAPGVRRAVAEHPRCPVDLLDQAAADREITTRAIVASHGGSSPATLRRLATDPRPEVRLALALREGLPADIEARLAEDRVPAVRRTIASRPAASAELLELLSHDQDRLVREAVAQNPGCAQETLCELAADPIATVREPAGRSLDARRAGTSAGRSRLRDSIDTTDADGILNDLEGASPGVPSPPVSDQALQAWWADARGTGDRLDLLEEVGYARLEALLPDAALPELIASLG